MKSHSLFLALIISLLSMLNSTVSARPSGAVRKKVVVKKFTQYDFSGQTVQGSIRAPEVFYIFQRKRSEGHQVVGVPSRLTHHRIPATQLLLKKTPGDSQP